VVTTSRSIIGLVIANVIRPGAALPLDLGAHPPVPVAAARSGWDIALHLFPSNLIQHAAEGDVLPVVIFATLFGISLTRVGDAGKPVLTFFEAVAKIMFKYTDMVMRLTPLGVFGAMAYNVSHMASGQRTAVARRAGPPCSPARPICAPRGQPLLRAALPLRPGLRPGDLDLRLRVRTFLRAIREPALTAFSTASSEAALPRLLEDMVAFGVPRRVASFVIPTGYSFNLDGSTLYLVLASMTIAQAAHIDMPISKQLVMVLTFMLTSKGVAGVPRATLVIIAGTCASFGLPGEAGVAMILAVDEIMDMARTTINVIGNGLASVVIARWEGVLGAGPKEERAGLDAQIERSRRALSHRRSSNGGFMSSSAEAAETARAIQRSSVGMSSHASIRARTAAPTSIPRATNIARIAEALPSALPSALPFSSWASPYSRAC
jgi:proton glutamate symport protein